MTDALPALYRLLRDTTTHRAGEVVHVDAEHVDPAVHEAIDSSLANRVAALESLVGDLVEAVSALHPPSDPAADASG